jgi:hypothetical protein
MKVKSILTYFIVAATISTLFNSCRKRDRDDADNRDTSASTDNALAEGSYNDVSNISDQAAAGNLSSYFISNSSEMKSSLLSSCATITRDTVSVPHILTINFGTTNCLCNDGRYRRGIINVSYTGAYRDSASTHTITFNDYYVNDNKIMGTKTVVNNGHNAAGHLIYSITVNGQILKATGGTITWTSNRTREWIIGENTLTWGDDVYLITGSGSGTSANGNSFTVTITSPLRREIGCRHFVSGTFTLSPSGKPDRYFDFGNGTCDNQATVTINGHLYNITLN